MKQSSDLFNVIYTKTIICVISINGNYYKTSASQSFTCSAGRLFSTVGCHPTRGMEFESHEEGPEAYLELLKKLAQENPEKVVAFGEFGLDYDRLNFCDKETQKK